jgi:hypothetical protein
LNPGIAHWDILGPRVRDWLVAEAHKRTNIAQVYTDCLEALGVPGLSRQALRQGIRRYVPEWRQLVVGLPQKGVRVPVQGIPGLSTPALSLADSATGPTSPAPSAGRSLVDFVRAKRREGCKVCRLPPEVLVQLRDASAKKIPRSQQLEWLATDYGIVIDPSELDSHRIGRHEG